MENEQKKYSCKNIVYLYIFHRLIFKVFFLNISKHFIIKKKYVTIIYGRKRWGSSVYLYTNTVLGGFVRLSVCLSVCSSAIETTFPLSNFKTKHIFGTLMILRQFLQQFGALQAPQIF